jgi:hypothetical protein
VQNLARFRGDLDVGFSRLTIAGSRLQRMTGPRPDCQGVATGPNLPFDWERPCRSAARHSGHSLQLHDIGSGEG